MSSLLQKLSRWPDPFPISPSLERPELPKEGAWLPAGSARNSPKGGLGLGRAAGVRVLVATLQPLQVIRAVPTSLFVTVDYSECLKMEDTSPFLVSGGPLCKRARRRLFKLSDAGRGD
jgi:hypothetical protein